MASPKSEQPFKSAVPGVVWPGIPKPPATTLLAILSQLERTQWLEPDQLVALQLKQLQPLLHHVWQNNPFYRQRFEAAGYVPGERLSGLDEFGSLQVFDRRALQGEENSLRSRQLPKGHGPGKPLRTSGSTGTPITIHRNNIDQLFWNVLTLREHLWHQRDAESRVAIIRKLDNAETAPPPHGKTLETWGAPFSFLYRTGPADMIDLGTTPVRVQAEWLQKANPECLLTYPTNAVALARYFREHNLTLENLREVRTLSETLGEETRETCREVWGVPVTDMYSAQEVGYIALQCPDHEHYHVQSENLLVEVLNQEGERCTPGEVGRVVVTALHSYATPLIRYDIGDYAEVGEPCPCGRGLPVLKRVLGRTRNMLTLPNGDQVWPVVRPSHYSRIAPISQVQMIQHEVNRVEVRLVVTDEVTSEQEKHLTEAIHESLGHTFDLDFQYMENIPRSPGGKFEEFISRV